MKKFTVMILCVSTFFVGLGCLIESVGAKFKSDERALEIIRQARIAIGGEQNIKAMQALLIKGKASKTVEFDKMSRVESGEWELNLQLPNKLSKSLKIETENIVGKASGQTFEKKVDVVVVTQNADGETLTEEVKSLPSDKVFIVKKDGENITEDISSNSPQQVFIVKKDEGGNITWDENENVGGKINRMVVGERTNTGNFRKNELFRTMISLFLTPPKGTDAEYTFVGEQNVDGTSCEIVQVNSKGSSVKLFINKSTHLPVMMSYTDAKPMVFTFVPKEENNSQTQSITINRSEAPTGEFHVKFSDYRTVNGLQLPFKWVQTIDGKADETIEVSAYEFNPATIADKFNQSPQKIMIRTEKPNQ